MDRFHTTGTAVQQMGWKVLDIGAGEEAGTKGRERERRPARSAGPAAGSRARANRRRWWTVEAIQKKTRPPKRFTEATLLTAMETAGKTLDEKELSDAMKETGLGTPATRAQSSKCC